MKKIVNFWYLLNLLFWGCTPFLLMAQNTPATGLLPEDKVYDALTLIEKKNGSKYPIPPDYSLKEYCPIPGDQGIIGACVGWATGYHAMTIIKAIQEGIGSQEAIQNLAGSASYIFNNIIEDQDCDKGAYLTQALTFLQQYGTPPSILFKNSLSDCTARPDTKATKAALKNRINHFHPIFKSNEKDSIKIEETKLWLSRKKPVIIGLNLTKDFEDIAFGNTKWSPDLRGRTNAFHAMVVVGYKDRGTSGDFELLNSYGPYWGNDGFIQLNYENFGQLVKYAFVIDSIGSFPNRPKLDFQIPNKHTLGTALKSLTDVGLRRIQYRLDDSYYFETPSVYLDTVDNYYKPSDSPWDIGSQYQVIAQNLSTGRYLYVFSFDAQKEVISIWPSKDPIDRLRSLQYTEITIPSEMGALELSYPGKDYVVLLYSSKELTNFDQYLTKFEGLSGSFSERMQKVFGDLLIDKKLVTYTPDALHFNCESEDGLIPLIINFDIK